MRLRDITLALLALALLQGCAVLTAATVYNEIEYRERAKEGKVPPVELVRRCNRDTLVRDAEGRWQQDGPATTACLAEAGWEITADGWRRLP